MLTNAQLSNSEALGPLFDIPQCSWIWAVTIENQYLLYVFDISSYVKGFISKNPSPHGDTPEHHHVRLHVLPTKTQFIQLKTGMLSFTSILSHPETLKYLTSQHFASSDCVFHPIHRQLLLPTGEALPITPLYLLLNTISLSPISHHEALNLVSKYASKNPV